MGISKILVANRGEIAVRIIAAARKLGIATAQAVSSADRTMLAARLADETSRNRSRTSVQVVSKRRLSSRQPSLSVRMRSILVTDFLQRTPTLPRLGGGRSGLTLSVRKPKRSGAWATRRQRGRWPLPPESERCPGAPAAVQDRADAEAIARELGLPLMIKAAAGGGGRGIRIARRSAELEEAIPLASAEALAAFGDGGLYLERFIPAARHIEVQILGDGTNAIHVYERECSLQRRRQKVWEEAPAVCLNAQRRESLCASAVRLARRSTTRGAGTLEYSYNEATAAVLLHRDEHANTGGASGL